jgi:hypothetical protein
VAGGGIACCTSSCSIIPPNVFAKSLLPVGYGSGLGDLRFSGLKEPVGRRTRAATARVSSSALSYSGLLSLESLLRLLSLLSLLSLGLSFQKPLLRLPLGSRRSHAGGPEAQSA